MTARDVFTVGQSVQATPRFFQKHRSFRRREAEGVFGIVRGFGVTGQSIRVQLTDHRTTYRYSMLEWTPVEDGGPEPLNMEA